MTRSVVIGTGSCLPKRELTNADLETMVDTSDEWITTRTGIKSRRISGHGEETSKLGAAAARQALDMAGLAPAAIDLIIVCSISPDMVMPSCACLVQKELAALNAFAFDLNAACSGFVFGLDVADRYIKANPAMKILVIGAENLSARTNWQDRSTCVLFGDAAGACVLTGGEEEQHGLLATRLYSDGRLWQLLSLAGAPSLNPDLEYAADNGAYIKMAGPDVFKIAVRSMGEAVNSLLAQEGIAIDQIKLVIPHQANVRILRSLAEKLSLPFDRVYTTIEKYGNTSAASVPVALDEANRRGILQRGDLVLLCVFGGGFTWGAALLRW
ncbi:MAG: 3-oxoacyl-ACP synthase [Deltaproteobacteria bacterium RIFOXYD12_FULL_57_12]|nr:MAG: 3-oxoacyl-ACP synthase [Deltaproteobacteria bacterium RIFOXYD12_FULL_57_12]